MSKHADRAEALFLSGYNCAQAVFAAYAEDVGVDEKTAHLVASSLGGGMGHTGQICGAALGMALAVGMMKGYSDGADAEAKKEHSARVKRLVEEFRAEYGATGCAELCEIGNRQKCAAYVRFAADQVLRERRRRD